MPGSPWYAKWMARSENTDNDDEIEMSEQSGASPTAEASTADASTADASTGSSSTGSVKQGSAPRVDENAMPCPVYDQLSGQPCGKPMEPERLTCKEHDTRSSSTQISRLDSARRRYGV